MLFEWDELKAEANLQKHHVSFELAQTAFLDPNRIVTKDIFHSSAAEDRYFCYGMAKGKILTVRFTLRGGIIRIIGAAYWRKGAKIYEKSKGE